MEIILRDTGWGPIYKQIEEEIKRNILEGKLADGQQMPSIRQFARDLRLSVITTKRAYEDLEGQGILRTVPGKGCYVTRQGLNWTRRERDQQARQQLASAAQEARRAGMDLATAKELLAEYWEE